MGAKKPNLPLDPVEIWGRIKALTGKPTCNSSEFFAALAILGYSEGAYDGIFDTVRACGLVAIDDDWNFAERPGVVTKFVFICGVCGASLGTKNLRGLRGVGNRHRRKFHPAHRGTIRFSCISQPKPLKPIALPLEEVEF